MPFKQKQHDGRLAVGIEIRPVHGHNNTVALSHNVGHPVNQQGVDINAAIRQQPINVLDDMLWQQTFRQRQALANQANHQRS